MKLIMPNMVLILIPVIIPVIQVLTTHTREPKKYVMVMIMIGME